jgi:hypothetical protein
VSNIFSEGWDGFLSEDHITPYDRAHMAIYLSLLHASGEGLTSDEMARSILGLDPKTDPDGARAITENHLARARWLATIGCKHLLESETDTPADR